MRVYKILLYLYPASFRSEYGTEMSYVFAERRRMAANVVAVIALWIETFFEILFNAARVHWDILRQDLRYTERGITRSPGFALTAIVVTALGIGANTAVFSITDHVLIRSLPFAEPHQLVKLYENVPGYARMELSPPNYRDRRSMSTSFESMGAFVELPVNLIGQGDPKRLEGALASTEIFAALGIQPALGRLFAVEDDRDGAPDAVILSYGFWQSDFGGDPGVVGRNLRFDDATYTVIGVMPANFYFPDRTVRLWMGLSVRNPVLTDPDRNNNILDVLAKLKSTVSPEQARAEMRVSTDQLEREHLKENAKTKATVIPLRDEVTQQSRLLLTALFGASLCVLLIACTNLASLMLARGIARQRELTVRAAIGAGRERLVRQLLTESLVLAVLGGVAGMMFAVTALPLLAKLVPATLPIADATALDFRVLSLAAFLTCVTGLGFGVFPALRSCSATGLDTLRSKSGMSAPRERLRAALVVT
ncbi:MAG: ABC transporter permease [Acidobacteriota bacterium]|jgi:putative ABC transport system permease protein